MTDGLGIWESRVIPFMEENRGLETVCYFIFIEFPQHFEFIKPFVYQALVFMIKTIYFIRRIYSLPKLINK